MRTEIVDPNEDGGEPISLAKPRKNPMSLHTAFLESRWMGKRLADCSREELIDVIFHFYVKQTTGRKESEER
jgi:hypothetical protein